MSPPILATKLYVPPARSSLVARPHLFDRLNAGLDGKLTLIAAPAGFGKTTLVGEWLATLQKPVAWYSLDEGDGDLVRFLSYLVAAFQTVAPSIGEGTLARLHAPQPPPIESILTVLLNEVATVPHSLILVLDDYHVLDAQPIDHAVTYLLDHLPPRMHIVITTREDPPLPLARYRVRSHLTEIRATELRFTPAEAAEFFEEVMGLDLSAEEIADLETRTEGWIAGLQMAALAMQGLAIQGHADTTSFIQAFTGSHRFVLDYLVEEVLHNQPQHVRSFLLQTAILGRLSGPLCDAVTVGEDARSMLERLERGNLFLVPLDDQRNWFRYHHLFADVLHARLMDEQPHQVPVLHRRASQWYEQNGLLADAIQHALAAEDYGRAADLIDMVRPSLEKGTRDKTLRGWVEHLPNQLVRARPALNLGYAWALLDAGELEAANRRLLDVERALEAATGVNTVAVDETQYRAIPASLATARVYYAQAKGDVVGTIKHAEQALVALPEDAHTWRAQITALLGLTYWTTGDLDKAQRALQSAAALLQQAGNALDAIAGAFVVADIMVTRGQLHEARRTYEDALRLAAEHGEPELLGLEHVYSGLSDLHREWNDLTGAAQYLETSKRLGDRVGDRVWRYRWCLAQARLYESLGNQDDALNQLNEVEALYIRTPLPDVRPIAAWKTRAWLRQGKLSPALSWIRARGLSVDDDLSYAREFEHITLARVLIGQYKRERSQQHVIHQVDRLLARLLRTAEAGGRVGNAIEILMLQALAHGAQDNMPAALAALERALIYAESEGYVRTFVDEGPPMAQLLHEATDRGIMPIYAARLLAAFKPNAQKNEESPSHPLVPPPQPLIEPLSQRELDVLRLLNTELSGPEIADELVVALSTVRTHTKRIYGKLNVNSRRAAVKRAAELGLV